MSLELADVLPLLDRTPRVLRELLLGLPPGWTAAAEGPGTWSPEAIVGHLIHGERTDWIPRARIILERGEAEAFPPFDREGHATGGPAPELPALLDDFARLRAENLRTLASFALTPADLARRGRHPALGPVTLGHLLHTWVVHDLAHLSQIGRVMARELRDAVGPWRHPDYFRILG